MKQLSLCLLLVAGGVARAEQQFPGPEWEDRPNPLASPDAVPGGEASFHVAQFPKSLNYYLEQNVFCAELFGLLFGTLLTQHPVTLADEPHVARTWTVSDDRLTFTFRLDERARWSDGRPILAEDVKWTFDAVTNPTNLTGAHKVALEKFDSPTILDDRTIRFTARELHWRNLQALGAMTLLPSHIMATQEFNKVHFDFPVVAGPYRVAEVRRGSAVILERRPDWWLRDAASTRGLYNFGRLQFRFFKDSDNAFEAFRQGSIDVFAVYSARMWVTETTGDRFLRNWILKQRIYNYNPIGFQGFVMNMRRPPFDDLRVRKAFAHLVDRERMNRTLMYDQYAMLHSYFMDLYSAETPCPNEAVAFDPEVARTLLAEAGYRANPQTGILEREGRPLRIRLLARDAAWQKFYDIMTESMKNVGIDLVVDMKDWAAWSKDMDTYNFEVTGAAWAAGVRKDPESMWHSNEAERPSGFNYAGYCNPEVDALIERQRGMFDIEERHALVREVDRLVYRDMPYALMWYADYTRLLYWNKFGTPPTVLDKYGDERAAYTYWWYDADAADALAGAMESGEALPRAPDTVRFDEAFAP